MRQYLTTTNAKATTVTDYITTENPIEPTENTSYSSMSNKLIESDDSFTPHIDDTAPRGERFVSSYTLINFQTTRARPLIPQVQLTDGKTISISQLHIDASVTNNSNPLSLKKNMPTIKSQIKDPIVNALKLISKLPY